MTGRRLLTFTTLIYLFTLAAGDHGKDDDADGRRHGYGYGSAASHSYSFSGYGLSNSFSGSWSDGSGSYSGSSSGSDVHHRHGGDSQDDTLKPSQPPPPAPTSPSPPPSPAPTSPSLSKKQSTPPPSPPSPGPSAEDYNDDDWGAWYDSHYKNTPSPTPKPSTSYSSPNSTPAPSPVYTSSNPQTTLTVKQNPPATADSAVEQTQYFARFALSVSGGGSLERNTLKKALVDSMKVPSKYVQIDSMSRARRQTITRFTGTLFTISSDDALALSKAMLDSGSKRIASSLQAYIPDARVTVDRVEAMQSTAISNVSGKVSSPSTGPSSSGFNYVYLAGAAGVIPLIAVSYWLVKRRRERANAKQHPCVLSNMHGSLVIPISSPFQQQNVPKPSAPELPSDLVAPYPMTRTWSKQADNCA